MLSAGTRLGPYEIHSALGAGGMGEVYRARDTRLDRIVAVKVLPAHVAEDPDLRERFEREARAVSSLNHPNICTLFDVGSQDGTNYLVLEFLEGETLSAQLARAPLPIDVAVQIAVQICDALDAAHRQGIVHRDLKPANVMLTKAAGRHGVRQVKVLDFGLAKFKASEAAPISGTMVTMPADGLTGQGTILGTLQYMAPEQVEGRAADARTDLFALGAIVYEMVTGRRAFDTQSQASLVAAILERDPPSMIAVQPVTPPALERIVRKCLAKDPEARWQSARDLADELRWLADPASTVSSASSATGAPESPGIRRASVPWIVAGVAGVIAIASAVPAVRYLTTPVATAPVIRLHVVTPRTPQLELALSPDGRSLVFVAAPEGAQPELWLRSLGETTPRRLPGTERASYPFWSPDNRSIGFFADGRLKRLDLEGGAVLALTAAASGRGGAWSRDNVILFAPSAASPLFRVPAGGGEATAVTGLVGASSHRFPQFLPDGQHFVYFAQGNPETLGIYLASFSNPKGRRLQTSDTNAVVMPPDHLLFLRQGTLFSQHLDLGSGSVTGDPVAVADQVAYDSAFNVVAVTASSNGEIAYRAGAAVAGQELMWTDRTGKNAVPIQMREAAPQFCPELSPDGRRIALDRTINGNRDIWVLEPARHVETRFTFDASLDATPIWSPDGSRIVFRSVRSGVWDLYQKAATGAGTEEALITSPQYKVPSDWSQDGRFLLYGSLDPASNLDLWAMAFADRKPFVVARTPFEERDGQFSPDGRWVLYASNESGQFQVYVQPFPEAGGSKFQISTDGGTQPRWRRDGKEIFYAAPGGVIMAVDVTISSGQRSVESSNPVALFSSRINTSQSGLLRPQYTVTPDGQRFLLNAVREDAMLAPITIVLNWKSEK